MERKRTEEKRCSGQTPGRTACRPRLQEEQKTHVVPWPLQKPRLTYNLSSTKTPPSFSEKVHQGADTARPARTAPEN